MLGLTNTEIVIHNNFRRQSNSDARSINKLNGLIDQLCAKLAEVRLELAVSECKAIAFQTAVVEIKAKHSDLPCFALTGRTLDDGTPESVAMRDVWVPAFDAALAEREIERPQDHRNFVPEDFPVEAASAIEHSSEAVPESTVPQRSGLGRFFFG